MNTNDTPYHFETEHPDFKALRFLLNVPKEVVKPRALLVLVPGSNSDGRYMAYDKFWVDYAIKQNLALIGCFFQDKDPSLKIEGYVEDITTSGEALLNAIEWYEFKELIPEDLKLLLWGHSAGGEFNYEFNNWYPERVLAFVVNKGGCYKTGLCSKEARNNPAYFFIGIHDLTRRVEVVKGLHRLNVQVGAPNWILQEEDCHHEVHNSEALSLDLFNEALTTL